MEASDAAPRASLLQAIRIQLFGHAGLEPAPAPPPGTSPEEYARTLAQQPGVVAVLWLEPEEGGRESSALHALGDSGYGERSELVRVPGGTRPETERSLALKVREIVHALMADRAKVAAEATPAPPPREPEPPAAEPRRYGPIVALGGRVAPIEERPQWGGAVQGGVAFRSQALRLAFALDLAFLPDLDVASAASHVVVRELVPGLVLRAELRQGAVWLGLHAGASLAFVQAEGRNQRARGDASETLPGALLGVHVELPIARGFGLLAALGAQARLRRQRFTVDGKQLADLGVLRPSAGLALSWTGDGAR